ncbi:MAG: MauE/DoxX family redox-associated membrane protein [Myxococcota bacterium]
MLITVLERVVFGLFVFLMLAGAAGHVLNPDFYAPMVPAPIPLWFANVASTIVEGALGIMLIVPRTRRWGAIGFTALMVAFLPIHIWDLFREDPAVGSTTAAVVRLVFQFAFIAGGVWLSRRLQTLPDS